MIYCDLVVHRLDDFDDVYDNVVLLDNAQRSTQCDRSCLDRARRYVAAYSPQSLVNQRSTRLTSKDEHSIYLQPFSDDEVELYINNYNYGLDKKTKKYIGFVSSNIPLFVKNCMNIITLHRGTEPTASASQLTAPASQLTDPASQTTAQLTDPASQLTDPASQTTASASQPTDSLFEEFFTTINKTLDRIYFTISQSCPDIAELIINAFKGHSTEVLESHGIVYCVPGGKTKLTHSRFLQHAYVAKGLTKFTKHWHSLEKLVMLLLSISDTEVCTLPKNKRKSLTVTIPKVADTYEANCIDEVSTQMTSHGSTIYAVECIYNQPIFDIVVVDTHGRRAFFIQVSQQSYSSHSKPPGGGFMDPFLKKLQQHYAAAKYDGFYVYATKQMQHYTIKDDIYFMDIDNKIKFRVI